MPYLVCIWSQQCTLVSCTPAGREGVFVTSTQPLLLVPPVRELPRTWHLYYVQGLRAGSLSINFMAWLPERGARLLISSFPLTRLLSLDCKVFTQVTRVGGGCQDTMTDVGVSGNSSGLGMPSVFLGASTQSETLVTWNTLWRCRLLPGTDRPCKGAEEPQCS